MSRDGMSGKRENWWDRIAPFSHDECQQKYEELESKLGVLKEALEFYAPEKNWSQFISSGNVFDELDGDFCEAFENQSNNGPDGGKTAREALKQIEEEK